MLWVCKRWRIRWIKWCLCKSTFHVGTHCLYILASMWMFVHPGATLCLFLCLIFYQAFWTHYGMQGAVNLHWYQQSITNPPNPARHSQLKAPPAPCTSRSFIKPTFPLTLQCLLPSVCLEMHMAGLFWEPRSKRPFQLRRWNILTTWKGWIVNIMNLYIV